MRLGGVFREEQACPGPEEAWVFPQKARLMTGVRPCGAVVGPGLGPCWCEMGSRGGGGEGEGQAGIPALVLGGCCWPQGWAEPHTRFGGSPLCLGADPGQCPRAVAHRRPQQPRLCAVHPPGSTRGHTRQVCWKRPSALPMGTRALPGSVSDFSLNVKTVLV